VKLTEVAPPALDTSVEHLDDVAAPVVPAPAKKK
jgi:hypothetical protein